MQTPNKHIKNRPQKPWAGLATARLLCGRYDWGSMYKNIIIILVAVIMVGCSEDVSENKLALSKLNKSNEIEKLQKAIDSSYPISLDRFVVVNVDAPHLELRVSMPESETVEESMPQLKSTLIEGVLRTFVHTDLDEITITSSAVLFSSPGKYVDLDPEKMLTKTVSRKTALDAINSILNVNKFSDLVFDENVTPDLDTESIMKDQWIPAYRDYFGVDNWREKVSQFYELL